MNAPTASLTDEPLLDVRGLGKHFPLAGGVRFKALDGVSFTLQGRRTLGVVGESGCGKSTLGRTLMRLHEASEGTARFHGVDWIGPGVRPVREQRRWMQMVFQDPFSSLDPKQRVGRIVREPLDIHGAGTRRAERDERVRALLDTVGLTAADAERYPHEFSGGQRQRIAIARALALEPRLLVADEPVSALDVSIQSQILNLLMELRRRHDMAMIFISHDLSVVRHISDDVAVMYFGRIVEMGPAATLFQRPAHPYTQLLLSSVPGAARARAGEAATPLEVAGAELPDPAHPPQGCAFAARCPHATDGCRQSAPALLPLGDASAGGTVRVACHLHASAQAPARAPQPASA